MGITGLDTAPDAGAGQDQDEKFPPVGQLVGDHVALFDAEADQAPGHQVHPGVQFAVGQAHRGRAVIAVGGYRRLVGALP